MSELYYTQRQKKNRQPHDPFVGLDFWVAFRTYIDRLSDGNYFCKEFANACSDGYPLGRYDKAVANRLKEELGQIEWPISTAISPGSATILNLVEFFYTYVAKPTKEWFHNYCGSNHPEEYDVSQGRYEYTIQVNAMLKRFNHPYKLQKGRILRIGSEIMDTRIGSVEFKTSDTHLLRLVDSAVENFYDRTGKKKLDGLRSIVDAFERLKTLEGVDKKKSIAKVISKLSPVEEVRSHFDAHLRKLTELANRYTIRHHERDKVVLEDESLIEYLFYSYYNLIRLILEKYGLIG